MSTSHLILGLLARGTRHGYDLKKEHDQRFPAARPLAFGQVYATLERLASRGLIQPVDRARVDGPERTTFALTDAGDAELRRWLLDLEEPSPFVANPFVVKATVALLAADEGTATDYLRRQRAAHLERMRHFTRVKSEPDTPSADVLAADFALLHLDADLRWLDVALERIATLTPEAIE